MVLRTQYKLLLLQISKRTTQLPAIIPSYHISHHHNLNISPSAYKTSNPITQNPTNATTLPKFALSFIAAPVYCGGAVLVLLAPPIAVGLDNPLELVVRVVTVPNQAIH